MPRTAKLSGPIGNGWVAEKRLERGVHFIAYWKCFVPDPSAPLGRRVEYGGSYDLGPKVKHGEGLTSLSAARKKWLTICDAVMGRTVKEHPLEMKDKTFRWFAENVFIPKRKPRWRETTESSNMYFIGKLYSEFGDTPLDAMKDAEMQAYLGKLAEMKYSKSIVEHCLLYLRAILGYAAEKGAVTGNAASDLQLPDGIKREDRPYLSLEEYQRLLTTLPSKRDQVMTKLLYLGGLRRGELFGVKWGDLNGTSLLVMRQINRLGKEANVKTRASEDKIALPEDLCADLAEWRKWCANAKPDAYMFPSRSGTPINSKNWLDRVLVPAAKAAGIERITYHMFRRGLATEAHQLGIVDRNIQSQLRHASSTTTKNIYMREVPAEQAKAMELLSSAAKAGKS